VSSANLPHPARSGVYGKSASPETRRELASALFREDDEFAWRHGWQIQASRLGLSRTYRRPAFELLTRCRECCTRDDHVGMVTAVALLVQPGDDVSALRCPAGGDIHERCP
jgi:hypothetical protein